MSLKLVPFNETWTTHDKLDMHAIYRRPSLVEDEYGERIPAKGPDGETLWDLTTPLPVRKHSHWIAKGFEYVTLANATSSEGALHYVRMAARTGTLKGGSVQDYSQDPRTGGPWNFRKYIDGHKVTVSDAADHLREQVEMFGSTAVEAIRRTTDPAFRLPEHLRGIEPHRPMEAGAVSEGEPVPVVKRGRPKKEAATV